MPQRGSSKNQLEKSCQMLRENKYTISEISLKLGYSSIHYFSKQFKLLANWPSSEEQEEYWDIY